MINPTRKTSDTPLRILKLLIGLINKPMDYQEMFNCINSNFEKPVYTHEVLSKYLNTLRAIGLQIEKRNNKFHLVNFLVQIHLSEDEINALNLMEEIILKYGTTKSIKTLIDIKTKLLKFLDENAKSKINNFAEKTLNTTIESQIKQFEQLCDDKQKIKIEYENKIFTVEPKAISFDENNVYLDCYCPTDLKIKKLVLEKIKLIRQEPNKNSEIEILSPITFEISGRLAQIYKLKEGETIIQQTQDKLYIKCYNQDYEYLMKKLIRYKGYCKIIEPQELKDYFKTTLDDMIKFYE